MKIGFIGAGNMGSALASAASKSEGAELYVSDVNKEKAAVLAESLSAKATDNEEIAKICDYIFLAVKPKFVSEVLSEIGTILEGRDNFTVVSMAAGVNLSSLNAMVKKEARIIRIMPNTPVAVGKGIILTAGNSLVTESELLDFKRLLSAAGDVEFTDENLIDAGTALSGCSPAFVYSFIEALEEGAVKAGLSRSKAREYAAKTLIGASTLLLESKKEPKELREAVCSPGGSTIEGVKVLEAGGLHELVMEAVEASFKRTQELGK
jgi:pyrroline-5-carboxylate reductase